MIAIILNDCNDTILFINESSIPWSACMTNWFAHKAFTMNDHFDLYKMIYYCLIIGINIGWRYIKYKPMSQELIKSEDLLLNY